MEAVVEVICRNVATAKGIIRHAVGRIAEGRNCACGHALKHAVISDRSVIPVETRENLELILGKYL